MERGMRADRGAAHVTLRLVFGLGVMLLGLLLTLDNFGLLETRRFVRFWPLLLIGAGLAKLSHGLKSRGRPGGYFLIVVGLVLLLVNLGLLQFRIALPLFLLAVGA